MRVFNREQKPDKGGLETKVLIQETRGKGKIYVKLNYSELFDEGSFSLKANVWK